jgi:hypothetical protein
VFANYCILFNHQTKASKRFLHLLSSRLALCAGARVLQAAKEAAAGGGGSATGQCACTATRVPFPQLQHSLHRAMHTGCEK